jgi:hypothetical protein
MNAFVRHHQQDIAFSYSCFDRVVCNAYIQHLQWCGSIVNFLGVTGPPLHGQGEISLPGH